MYKTIVDKITLSVVTLRERRLPEGSITSENEDNCLSKDDNGKSLLQGKLEREYILTGLEGVKGMGLAVDFRPLFDSTERLDFTFDIRCIRNGKQVDKLMIKHTFVGLLRSNGKNIIEFEMTNKKLLKNKAVEDNDVLVITMKQTRQPNKPIYFANMYITKG